MMENMLQAVIVVFMLFLCALCLFAVVVIARDIVHESAKARREREREEREDRLSAIERQLALQINEQKPPDFLRTYGSTRCYPRGYYTRSPRGA